VALHARLVDGFAVALDVGRIIQPRKEPPGATRTGVLIEERQTNALSRHTPHAVVAKLRSLIHVHDQSGAVPGGIA
jgi:hypothetical protein